MPRQPVDPDADLRRELAVFRNGRVWLALLTTALGFGGVFAAFTFIAPMMTELAGFSDGAVTWLLVLFTVTAHSQLGSIVTIALLGFAGFATVPALQTRTMEQAAGAPTLASAANIGAFNLGNAAGAWLAGLTLDAGWGYTSPSWVGAGLVATGLAVALLSGRLDRRAATATAHHPLTTT